MSLAETPFSAGFSLSPSNKQGFVDQSAGQHAVILALGADHELDEQALLILAGSVLYLIAAMGRCVLSVLVG